MLTLNVDIDEKSYPIYIGQDLLLIKSLLTQHITGKQIMIVSNTTVVPLYLATLKQLLTDFIVKEIVLPDGEVFKTLEITNLIWDALLENKFDRSCTLIALGGGVVGDMTGFAASGYQRGVNFIQVPTTLLSQVDSSVGGKTGVNHPLGKNMIGAFYQPKCVIIDINTLETLDARQFSAGIAEVIKYGLLGDIKLYQYIIQNISNIMQLDTDLIQHLIFTCCQNKANIVAQDELEQGVRALLNFGHTFGHAIENSLGYGEYLHGEAISVGMLMAARMSELEGYLQSADIMEIQQLLKVCNLTTSIKGKINPKDFLASMAVDKKSLNGNIRLILLQDKGKAFITQKYKQINLIQVITEFCN